MLSDSWIHVRRRAMACGFCVTLPSESADLLVAATAALDLVDALEARLSVFRPDSEITRLNRASAAAGAAGGADGVDVAADLHALLALCARLHEESAGAFDVTAGPLSEIWGFSRRAARIPSDAELAAARARVGMDGLVLAPGRGATPPRVRFARPGTAINLGAIGKGYALDRAADVLRSAGAGAALLSAGGSSLLALGGGVDGRGFRVALRDPRDPARDFGWVRLRDRALGVSGAGEQGFRGDDGRRRAHVVDPRTGRPVVGRRLAAALAPTAALADALSTAAFVGGAALARRMLRAHPEVEFLLVDDEPRPRVQTIGARAPWSLERVAA